MEPNTALNTENIQMECNWEEFKTMLNSPSKKSYTDLSCLEPEPSFCDEGQEKSIDQYFDSLWVKEQVRTPYVPPSDSIAQDNDASLNTPIKIQEPTVNSSTLGYENSDQTTSSYVQTEPISSCRNSEGPRQSEPQSNVVSFPSLQTAACVQTPSSTAYTDHSVNSLLALPPSHPMVHSAPESSHLLNQNIPSNPDPSPTVYNVPEFSHILNQNIPSNPVSSQFLSSLYDNGYERRFQLTNIGTPRSNTGIRNYLVDPRNFNINSDYAHLKCPDSINLTSQKQFISLEYCRVNPGLPTPHQGPAGTINNLIFRESQQLHYQSQIVDSRQSFIPFASNSTLTTNYPLQCPQPYYLQINCINLPVQKFENSGVHLVPYIHPPNHGGPTSAPSDQRGSNVHYIKTKEKCKQTLNIGKNQDSLKRNMKSKDSRKIKTCINCFVTVTSTWRKVGKDYACNPCGLHFRNSLTHRPPSTWKNTILKRNRKKTTDSNRKKNVEHQPEHSNQPSINPQMPGPNQEAEVISNQHRPLPLPQLSSDNNQKFLPSPIIIA